jgi:septal ring factor EnvC (AmiA/AmiB activator)
MATQNSRLEARIAELERWQHQQETEFAVQEEQVKNINSRFDKVDHELEEIKNAMWKVVWVVGSAFAAAVVAWIINGGLKIG